MRQAVFMITETGLKRSDDGSFQVSGGQRAKGLVATGLGDL